MREIERAAGFKADYKREIRTDASLKELLRPVLECLVNDGPLPEKCRDHSLGGKWKGFRGCHIKPDLVLIYTKYDGVLALARLGSHAELFG